MKGDHFEVDGARGEGGGQILRTSLALSLATGRPVRIRDIRAGRERPGLLRQHLTAVRAAAAVGGAEVTGDSLGSREVTFRPGPIRPGHHEFSVGTAGSACLVLQTVLLPLALADAPSTLVLEGGTHNPAAPPFDYVDRVWLPLLRRMGLRVEATLERAGFFPAGGGRLTVRVEPPDELRPLALCERGDVRARSARVLLSRLPGDIGERQRDAILRSTGWNGDEVRVLPVPGAGPGNVVLLEVEADGATEMFCAFGARGVKAEHVVSTAVRAYRAWLAGDRPVGRHLADQLMLPLALIRGGRFRTGGLSSHARTNLELLRDFGRDVSAGDDGAGHVIEVAAGSS